MNNTHTMLDTPSTFRSLYWPVAIILALLLGLLWLMGYGPGGSACKPAVVAMPEAPKPAVVATPEVSKPVAAAPVVVPEPVPAAPPATNAVSTDPLPNMEKVYFAVKSTEVKASTGEQLAGIVAYLKANPSAKAVLSGFHDPTGNKAANETLALNRARAVRSVLEAAGIPKERVEMAKPVETTGTGSPEEARRVQVGVIP